MTDEKQPNPTTDPDSLVNAPTQENPMESGRRPAIKIGSQREARPQASDATTSVPAEADEGDRPTPPPDKPLPAAADIPMSEKPEDRAREMANENASESPPAGAAESAETDAAPRISAEKLFPAPPIKRVSADLQAEIDAALGDLAIDDLLAAEARPAKQANLSVELDERYSARVIKLDREFVFVSLGPQHEGMVSRRQFAELPEPGTILEVIPTRYLTDDHLYEVIVPGASMEVQDWADLAEGIVVEARITGHNKGGLECEVNRIRGFIPASQVSLYRVDDLESYVGQSLQCLVTEANEDRRNLVLSHRAVLEREKEESRQKLLEELQVGQIREGIVRRLQHFGAFVDLGGIDGLIHVSQLSWDRVGHPSEVLEEGQKVRVRIEKIDPVTGKVGLSYRDLLEDPWENAESTFPVGSVINATISKIMEFGAFVKLAPGIEGLVHISEIAHQRVHRVGAVLKEGDSVQVKVLSIDRENQRVSLSIKAAQATPAEQAEESSEPDLTSSRVPPSSSPLQGGLGRKSGGEQFGLKW
jgi:predicted RNA-binding protein with RPS1 domain